MRTTLPTARARIRAIAPRAALFAAATAALSLAACQSNTASSSREAAGYQTGRALGDLVGSWNVTGWSRARGGQQEPMRGTARATRDKNYFVRMDLSFPAVTSSTPVEGTGVFSQRGGHDLELTTWFSSSPVMRHYRGSMNAAGTQFDFSDAHAPDSRTLRITISGPDSLEAEVWSDGQQVERYSFTRN